MDDREELARRVAQLERQLADMFSGNQAIKLLIDPAGGTIVSANPAAARFYGYSIDELEGLRISDLNQLPTELVQREMDLAHEQQRTYFEFKHRLRSGELRDVEVYSGPCEVGGRRLLFSVIFDITERKRLTEDLAHGQRMEALGRLAGGMAHDFNNLLTSFELLRSVLERRLRRGSDPSRELADLKTATARGTALTAQLLAFCRRQPVSPVLLDMSDVVRGMERMLRGVLGEHITLSLQLQTPAPVIGDRSQLENVLLNLALNAADAMSAGGGSVHIAVRDAELDAVDAARLGMLAGPVVLLEVSDTGIGVPPELHDRLFEPFFTTKPPGRGTGLGLATVYGVARQWRGAIEVESVPGHGSRFVIHWPRAAAEPTALPGPSLPPETPASDLGGHETLLLAEDDDTSRPALSRLLEEVGYRVLVAVDGRHALDLSRAHEGTIDLLLTDVVMPRMSGPELGRLLTRERPDLRVLYMSGYVDIPGVDLGLLDASERLLAKPFTVEAMLAMLRAILDGPRRR